MPSQRDIRHQQEQLQRYRERARHYEGQRATLGQAFEPPVVAAGISEAQRGIAQCKARLRSWGRAVEDLPEDGDPLSEDSRTGSSDASNPRSGEVVTEDLFGDVEPSRFYRRFPLAVIFGALIVLVAGLWILFRFLQPPFLFLAEKPSSVPLPTFPPQPSVIAGTAQPSACSQTIRFGEVVTCSLSGVGRDSYTFDAEQNDQVLIVVAQAQEKTTASIKPEVSLLLPNSAMLSDCELSDAWVVEKICQLPQAGRYELRVKGKPTQGNVYRVWIQRLNNPGSAMPVAVMSDFSGAITQAAQFDTYVINTSEAARVTIHIDPNIPGENNNLEPWFAIYDIHGNLLPGGCEGESSSIAEGLCNLPTAGPYTMLVAAKRRNTQGGYMATISKAQ